MCIRVQGGGGSDMFQLQRALIEAVAEEATQGDGCKWCFDEE